MKYNLTIAAILIVALLIALSGNAQKPIPVKVEHIEKVETGYEVWVKRHNPHYRHGSYHLVKTFAVLPDSIKIGKTIYLYPSQNKNEFRVVKP